MMNINYNDLIFNKPLKFNDDGVYIKIPTVEEVAYKEDFNTYLRVFTVTTREFFATQMNVDELELKYPTLLSMTKDEESDFLLGMFLKGEKDCKGSAVIMEALHYWTGLQLDGENGFLLLETSGKIAHYGTGWVMDDQGFSQFSDVIKLITNFEPSTDYIPPKPMKSKAQYNAWMGLYKGRVAKASRGNGVTLADKILILAISMGSYIPPEEIKKMSIFMFNKLFDGLSKKEAYGINMRMIASGNFNNDKMDKRHWKETFRIKK